ncbi:hypothetical protein NDU88_001242 [Pleurodeles waltl]|uniref:Uncharacterized protein n=1 Tax=Pleurodeles waltl TaxID=8319 RepID=A0AAV7PAK8_PLEWA|nr:hypothetical protein NDU88_001242 [Pleurodeles waltl]
MLCPRPYTDNRKTPNTCGTDRRCATDESTEYSWSRAPPGGIATYDTQHKEPCTERAKIPPNVPSLLHGEGPACGKSRRTLHQKKYH